MLVYLVIYDSGWVSLVHLVLSRYPSQSSPVYHRRPNHPDFRLSPLENGTRKDETAEERDTEREKQREVETERVREGARARARERESENERA